MGSSCNGNLRTINLQSKQSVPQQQASADVQALLSITTFVDDIEEQVFDSAPDWFNPPVATALPTFSPDMVNVEQITSLNAFVGHSSRLDGRCSDAT